jgi:hypothetical protein
MKEAPLEKNELEVYKSIERRDAQNVGHVSSTISMRSIIALVSYA